MDPQGLAGQLRMILHYFNRSTEWLTEEDAGFVPVDGMMSAAQQIAHVAQTVDWFIEGALGSGWNMDFAAHEARVRQVTTLADARAWLGRSFENAISVIESTDSGTLLSPLPKGEIMEGAPRGAIVAGISEHTSHHRGALTVYARLRGKVAPMPYM